MYSKYFQIVSYIYIYSIVLYTAYPVSCFKSSLPHLAVFITATLSTYIKRVISVLKV